MEIINAGPRNIPFLNDNLMNRKAVVFFVAPWCGHCQRLEPTINKLMGRFKNDSYPGLIARVQEKEIPKVKCDNDIQGFPTIRVLKPGGKKEHDYEGSRDEGSLSEFLAKIFEQNNKMHTKSLPFRVTTLSKTPKKAKTKAEKKNLNIHRKLNEERQEKMRLYSALLKKEATALKKTKKKKKKPKKKPKKTPKKAKTAKKQSGGAKKKKTYKRRKNKRIKNKRRKNKRRN